MKQVLSRRLCNTNLKEVCSFFRDYNFQLIKISILIYLKNILVPRYLCFEEKVRLLSLQLIKATSYSKKNLKYKYS